MKRYFLILCALMVICSACSTAPPAPTTDSKDKWVNITNAQNKIVAAFNANDGKVVYYADPKEAFETLLQAFGQYQAKCKLVEEKPAPKKKEEKKK